MTNQSSDTQPALRPFNVSVRGGRLIKFKGQVASIAPSVSVVATAAVLLIGGLNQAAAQQAADACGVEAKGDPNAALQEDRVIQDTITCDAPTDPSITPYADGITYTESDGLTLILDDADIEVGGSGVHVVGSTSGEGYISVHLQNGKVGTDGVQAYGLQAQINNGDSTATVTALMTQGDINTGGRFAVGLLAETAGDGAALAQMDGGTITTIGRNARGLWAHITNADSEATVTALMTQGNINTSGASAFGLLAETAGVGVALAQMDGGTITTSKENAHGLWALSRGGLAVVDMGEAATVTASGSGAHGILAEGETGFDVDVAGSVTGGDDNGAAIRTPSSAGGTIDIASTATVTTGGSGYAILDGNGAANITSEGIVTGDVRLWGGDDTLNLTGGSFTGDIYGGPGNDTLTLQGGSFNGDIYGGAGDDTVTISAAVDYDFSRILDGGEGDNDHLTLRGHSITTSADRLTNWEGLRLDGLARLDMGLSVDAGSVFHATGQHSDTRTEMTIAGDVTNAGDMTLSVQDGAVGDVITIDGDYTGSGSSVFALDARMDGTDTDTLHFMGDVTGDMELSIASVAGVESAPLEFDVVTVDGASDGATFTLMEGSHVMSDGEHAFIAGAYLYRLAETDSGWALSALSEDDEITWQPASPLYDSYGAALLGFNTPASLRNRGSSQDFRSLAWDGGAGADTAGQDAGSPLWVQMGTEQITSSEENSTTGAALESGLWEMQMGADIVLNDSAAGLLVGGLMLSYATGSTDVTSDFGDGSIDTTGLGLGLSATWYDTRGFYVDGQVRLASYTSDLSSDSLGTLTEGNSGTGLALSIEAGQRLDLGSRLTVIPQAQLSLSSVAFSDFTSEPREGPQGEAQQEQVALSEATSQRLRLGLEVGEQDPGASGLYGMLNLFHEFGAGSEVEVDGTSLMTEHEPWAVGVGLGGTYAWSDRVDLFGEASYATGLSNAGETSTLSASAGLKVTF